ETMHNSSKIPLGALSLIFFALFSAPAMTWAAEENLSTQQAHSEAKFIFDQDGFVPGQKVRAGLKIKMDPKWHTYWLNPGDSGAPIIFDWKLPPGWKAGSIHFPPPERIATPPLETFGFEGEIILWTDLMTSTASTEAKIQLDAEWLVCADVCIPAIFSFSQTLQPRAQIQKNSHWHLFNTAEAMEPQLSKDAQGRYDLDGNHGILHLNTPTDWKLIDLFPGPQSRWANRATTFQNESPGLWKIQIAASKIEHPPKSERILFQYTNARNETHFSWVEVSSNSTQNLWWVLMMAFLGGLILNLMPCVFPLISIKIFSLLKESKGHVSNLRKANLLYSLGVLVSFWTLGFLLFSLRSQGEALGWGFQLQSPHFVIFMILLLTLMAFSFLGWFEVDLNSKTTGQWMNKTGPLGHFLTGVLSTVVASPCTAPFMGVALGFALSQPLPQMLAVFTSLGLGLSFPYLVLSIHPAWTKLLPRPGAWMETLKTFMAFPLLATVIWLSWFLSFQVSPFSLSMVWTALLILSLAIWSRRYVFKSSLLGRRLLSAFLFLIAFVLPYWTLKASTESSPPPDEVLENSESEVIWQKFSPQKVEALRQEGRAVFVDFTAAWCITCQVNKQVTFKNQQVIEFVKSQQIQMLLADWTRRDPVITQTLNKYQRAGVPFYLFYPADPSKSAVILPEVLTPDLFIESIGGHL
ncbi:MAG: thioredoxin family protein, partial [Bdellovibrionales bacterium]|nr:thioredoxin family protein [Bdellovibrionales bacterium]